MTLHKRLCWLGAAAFGMTVAACGQITTGCGEVSAAAAMVRASNVRELTALRVKAGKSYLADVVFAARDFELNSKDVARARRLLPLMPKFETENYPDVSSGNAIRTNTLLTMADGLCEGEADTDQIALARMRDALPATFAKAVILAPEFMSQYISYDMEAASPHSDANVQTEKVCRIHRAQFAKAVAALDEDGRDGFKRMFDVRHCRAIWLPESDE